ncbi:hypothetical protein AB0J86_27310 [Micromonospora sp. NPDC049559]|uniref:hypothetical protein n=1 Tax=Micromonospora sp. NPDC049559 TaxID=3155923 RepID=UPI00343D760F
MQLQRTLELLRTRPGMLGVDGSFGQTVAFLAGMDAGQNGGLLRGFREWLVVRLGDGANLTWRGLILRLTFPDGCLGGVANLSVEDEQRAISVLFDQLTAFLAVRDSADGLLNVYDSYLKWLRSQDWYMPPEGEE